MANWIAITIFAIVTLIIIVMIIRKINKNKNDGYGSSTSFGDRLNKIKQGMIDCCTGKGLRRI